MTSSTTLSRRRLAQGAAWTLPAVAAAAAAPAMAASLPCPPVSTLDWSIQPHGPSMNGVSVIATTPVTTPVTPPISVTISATGDITGPDNLVVMDGPDGGLPAGQDYLNVGFGGDCTCQQVVSFTFSAPVYNLTFTLGDIDSYSGNVFQEAAWLTPGFAISNQGASVSGLGTATNPFTATLGLNVPPESSAGNVTVLYPGPVTVVQLTMLDVFPVDAGASGHSLDVFNMTFNTLACV